MITRITRKTKHGIHEIVLDNKSLELYKHYNWSIDVKANTCYLKRNIYLFKDGKRTTICFKFHRELMNVTDPNLSVDHINGNGLDNRISNLRVCSQYKNTLNKKKKRGLKFKGIQRHGNKYRSDIRINGQRIYLGLFNTPEEAAEAYDNAAQKYHGKFANINKYDSK